MSIGNEEKLVQSLVWSKEKFSLAKFVETYKLPQVVRVMVGYCGDTERRTLSSDQILTLHALRKTTKVICEDSQDDIVLISLDCPLKVEVRLQPKDCKHSAISPQQLAKFYSHVKYVRVLPGNKKNLSHLQACEANAVLKVRRINHAKRSIKCIIVATGQEVSVSFNAMVLFAPLLDHRQFTLAEIKQNFGLPARVRFCNHNANNLRPSSDTDRDQSMLVTSLGDITVWEEIEETDVISTTISENRKDKICLQIPKDLNIEVAVAEGFISGSTNYEKIVRTLDQAFNRTNLRSFKNMDVYQHLDAVKKGIQDMSLDVSVERASECVRQRVMERRQTENTGAEALSDLVGEHLGRDLDQLPGTYSEASAEKKRRTLSKDSYVGSKVLKRVRPWHFSWNHQGGRQSYLTSDKRASGHKSWEKRRFSGLFQKSKYKEKSCKAGESFQPEVELIYVTVRNDELYTELNRDHEPDRGNVYQKLRSIDGSETGTKSTINHPQFASDVEKEKRAVAPTFADIPQDLSGLSVKDVGNLLIDLGMAAYVGLFAKELVDGEMLASLDRVCLESLNLSPFHITKLLKYVNGWRPLLL